MATFRWAPLVTADGTALSSTNVNEDGNGPDDITFIATSGGATRTVIHETNGVGLAITGPDTSLARLDTPAIAGGIAGMAAQCVLVAPASAPTVGAYLMMQGRSAAAGAGSFQIKTDFVGAFFNSPGTQISSGAPAMVASNVYDVDIAIMRSLGTVPGAADSTGTNTPSTTNGRIICRIKSRTNPNWVSSGVNEFYQDTGYTVNVGLDLLDKFRFGKSATAGAVGTHRILNSAWRSLETPNHSTVKANAITNFVQPGGPTVATTGTGGGYPIVAVGTPVAAGAISYGIVQTGGPTHAAAATAVPGIWTVTQDPDTATQYTVTVTEAGAGATPVVFDVPALPVGPTGMFRRRTMISGVLVGG